MRGMELTMLMKQSGEISGESVKAQWFIHTAASQVPPSPPNGYGYTGAMFPAPPLWMRGGGLVVAVVVVVVVVSRSE